MSERKNALVAQSGGPTAAINASLAGVIRGCLDSERIGRVYGARNGVEGLMDERLVDLSAIFENDSGALDILRTTPSMYLGSCRRKLKPLEKDSGEYDHILEIFRKYDIGYFFYIGGNDSMDTVGKLSRYVRENHLDIQVVGVPKTVDNDLTVTDHTPGFGSAAKYVAASVLEMAHDTYIYNTRSVLIVEIMGRDAGWLTASSVLARNDYSDAPHLIYLPEHPFSKEQFIADLREQFTQREKVIVAVSEGIRDAEGHYMSAETAAVDAFGHAMLSGAGKCLEGLVTEVFGCKVRSIELSVLQRCAAHMASETDLEEGFRLGVQGVSLALEGRTGEMAILRRISDDPYQVEYDGTDVQLIANQEKKVPAEWINAAGNDVTAEMIAYLRPLIQGQPKLPVRDGLPHYLFLK